MGDLRVKIEAAGILPDSNLGPPTDVSDQICFWKVEGAHTSVCICICNPLLLRIVCPGHFYHEVDSTFTL